MLLLLKNRKVSEKPKESCGVYSKTNKITIIRKISYKKRNIKNSKYYYKRLNKFMGLHYYFYKSNEINYKKLDEESIILFFDRVDLACDNAFILYDLMKEYKNKFFVIDFNSSDYKKLLKLGYNLVDYNSDEFKSLYLSCDFIMSSSFDQEIINYQNLRSKSKHRFVFLQHGVVDKDLNYYFVDCEFDYIVCSNDFEQKLLLNKHTFFQEQLLNTGLVRFHKLKNESSKYIVLSFTWRGYLRNDKLEVDLNKLEKSKYLEMFDDVILNKKLSDYAKNNELEFVVILHPQFKELGKFFKSRFKNTIFIMNYDYTFYINNAHFLITDYSSVFNDFSYLGKPVYFYQKDSEEFFSNHIAKRLVNYDDLNGIVVADIDDVKYQVKIVNQYYKFDCNNLVDLINKKSV